VKISVFPKGELDAIVNQTLSVPAWIASVATLPIDGVELYSGMFDGANDDALAEVADCLAEHHLVMPMLCASPDFTHPDPMQRAAELVRQRRMIEIASRLGGPGVSCRVLSGQRHPGVSQTDGTAWTVDAITALLPLARDLEVILAMENHYKDGYWRYPEFAQSPDVFCDILDRIEDRVHFGVQYDPSNAILAGADPVDFLRLVVDRVVTMQASDRRLRPGARLQDVLAHDAAGYSADLEHGVIGEGLNDYPAIFGLLVDAGYDGWISIEDGVNGYDDLRASAEFLVDARSRYFGGSHEVSVAARATAIAAASR